MAVVCRTRRRTSDLDNNLETARRELAALERTEAEEITRRQAELHRWYERKLEQFAPTLERFLSCFPMIRDLDNDWRRDVFCGREQVEQETEQAIRGLYGLWLSYSRMFKEKAEYLARHLLGKLDDSLALLEKCAREGDRILRGWEPPLLSRGYSFRAPALSQEAAARFDEMFPTAR
jgi:hypothetical protein